MKQKIGIIAAADDEIQPLIAQMRIEKTEEAAMLKFIEGTWQGQSITAVRCGVGKVNAALATQLLIEKQVSAVIMIGTAGALDPNLRIGDVIIYGVSIRELEAPMKLIELLSGTVTEPAP